MASQHLCVLEGRHVNYHISCKNRCPECAHCAPWAAWVAQLGYGCCADHCGEVAFCRSDRIALPCGIQWEEQEVWLPVGAGAPVPHWSQMRGLFGQGGRSAAQEAMAGQRKRTIQPRLFYSFQPLANVLLWVLSKPAPRHSPPRPGEPWQTSTVLVTLSSTGRTVLCYFIHPLPVELRSWSTRAELKKDLFSNPNHSNRQKNPNPKHLLKQDPVLQKYLLVWRGENTCMVDIAHCNHWNPWRPIINMVQAAL